MTIFGCALASCETIRVGIIVNLLFLLAGSAVIILIIMAIENEKDLRTSVRVEVMSQLVHSGYSLYLVAGSAFAGACTFSDICTTKSAFIVVWLIVLLTLLLFEFARARFKPPKTKFSITRKLTLPIGVVAIWWVWTGAQLSWVAS